MALWETKDSLLKLRRIVTENPRITNIELEAMSARSSPEATVEGVCGWLEADIGTTGGISDYIEEWPEFSGEKMYPVPGFELTPDWATTSITTSHLTRPQNTAGHVFDCWTS